MGFKPPTSYIDIQCSNFFCDNVSRCLFSPIPCRIFPQNPRLLDLKPGDVVVSIHMPKKGGSCLTVVYTMGKMKKHKFGKKIKGVVKGNRFVCGVVDSGHLCFVCFCWIEMFGLVLFGFDLVVSTVFLYVWLVIFNIFFLEITACVIWSNIFVGSIFVFHRKANAPLCFPSIFRLPTWRYLWNSPTGQGGYHQIGLHQISLAAAGVLNHQMCFFSRVGLEVGSWELDEEVESFHLQSMCCSISRPKNSLQKSLPPGRNTFNFRARLPMNYPLPQDPSSSHTSWGFCIWSTKNIPIKHQNSGGMTGCLGYNISISIFISKGLKENYIAFDVYMYHI